MADHIIPRRQKRINAAIGQRFGRWTVLSYEGIRHRTHVHMLCRCDCGVIKSIHLYALHKGLSQSCGCRRPEVTKKAKLSHGHARVGAVTPEYTSWAHMVRRCEDPTNPKYKDYGARGITVHPSLRQFVDFLAYMGPSNELTIERLDVNGNYEPGNIVWLPKNKQAANRRDTVWVFYLGERIRLHDVCVKTGLDRGAYYVHLRKGLTPQEAFEMAMLRRKLNRHQKAPVGK